MKPLEVPAHLLGVVEAALLGEDRERFIGIDEEAFQPPHPHAADLVGHAAVHRRRKATLEGSP